MAGNKVTEELVSMVRSIVGDEYTEMDIIRSLHMAKNDPTAAINIIFDTPSFKKIEIRSTDFNSEAGDVSSNSGKMKESEISTVCSNGGLDAGSEFGDSGVVGKRDGCDMGSECGSNGLVGKRAGCDMGSNGLVGKRAGSDMGSEWWYVGCGEVAGMSTCKGRILKPGDEVEFTFPVEKKLNAPSPGKFGGGRGRQAAACSEIVRFSTKACGEVMLSSLCSFPLNLSLFVAFDGILLAK